MYMFLEILIKFINISMDSHIHVNASRPLCAPKRVAVVSEMPRLFARGIEEFY